MVGEVELHEHGLKALAYFTDMILDNTKLQRFLGCMNDVRYFYEAKDANISFL